MSLELFVFRSLEMEKRLGAPKGNILKVMMLESGCKASTMREDNQAVGLIQFLPSNLKNMGFLGTPKDFSEISEVQQLRYVERFLSGKDHSTLRQSYCAVFMPADNKAAADPTYVISQKGGKRSWAFDMNSVLDGNGDGVIQAGEVEPVIEAHCWGPRWQEICKWAQMPYVAPENLVGTKFWVQAKLLGLGFYAGQVDGIFGPATYKAVKAFQANKGLVVDGVPGPKTMEVLRG